MTCRGTLDHGPEAAALRLISAAKANKVDIDCPEMSLRRRGADKPLAFAGRGRIWQDADGVLKFEIGHAKCDLAQFVRWFNAQSAGIPGRLYEEGEYFDLRATAANGTEWLSERFLVKCNGDFRDSTLSPYGELHELKSVDAGDTAHRLEMHFVDDLEVPTMAGTYEFSTRDYAFEIRRQQPGEFVVRVQSQTPLAAHLHVRIQEALMFMLGRSVSWRAWLRHEDGRCTLVLASATKRPVAKGLPPIFLIAHDHLQDIWNLFSCYLEFAERMGVHPYWIRCTYHLSNAREAQAGSIDTWAAGLAIAVEGISSYIEVKKTKEEKDGITNLQAGINQFVAGDEEFSKFQVRIGQLLNMLNDDRVVDRLTQLEKMGHVDPRDIAAWKKMRNKNVHPRGGDLQRVTASDHQELFDLINKNTVLLYHLVFHLIEYRGSFVDYGTRGYPFRDYPLPPPPQAAPE